MPFTFKNKIQPLWRDLKGILALLLLPAIIISCATTNQITGTTDRSPGRGVWHRVTEGQTLWRIARTYRISLEDIKDVNDIKDVLHISRGTWIFIPNAEKVLFVQGSVDNPLDDNTDIGFVWPLKGDIVRPFGKFENDFNYGIDIKAGANQDIYASFEGMVVVTGTIRGYGTTIIIEHGNNFFSLYSRNVRSLVREGQVVKKNSVIAKTGSSRETTTEVVHYELFYKGKPVNPLFYLP